MKAMLRWFLGPEHSSLDYLRYRVMSDQEWVRQAQEEALRACRRLRGSGVFIKPRWRWHHGMQMWQTPNRTAFLSPTAKEFPVL